MTKHVIKNDTDDGLLVTKNGDQWLIKKGVEVTNGLNNAIVDGNGGFVDASGLKFVVGGTLGQQGEWAYDGSGDNCRFEIQKSGEIAGYFRSVGDDFTVSNRGKITADFAFSGERFLLDNRGTIEDDGSPVGLSGNASGRIINREGGLISGENGCIDVTAGYEGVVVIRNDGTIKGDGSIGAIRLSDFDSDDKLINTGRIEGGVDLGGGDDRFVNKGTSTDGIGLGEGNDTADLRGGKVLVGVSGQLGNDIYIVDKAKVLIYEGADGGYDTVKANVSFTLGEDFEYLVLTGKGNIDGEGNELTNVLTGNSGANDLRGMAGNDILLGLAGNDRLFGGTETDLFTFKKGCDQDRIMDFELGTDLINLQNYQGIDGFDDLKIKDNSDGDAVITLSGGDRITVIGIEAADLKMEHFAI